MRISARPLPHPSLLSSWFVPSPLVTSSLVASFFLLLCTVAAPASAQHPKPAPAPAVTIKDDGANFILANGYLTATINKKTGDMLSLKVHDLETQGYVSGHHAGYWEQNPNGAARMEAGLTIDPATNNGERGEVSIKGWSDGKNLNGDRRVGGPDVAPGPFQPGEGQAPTILPPGAPTPPPGVQRNRGTATGPRSGANRGPGLLVDMEIRYALERGGHGVYTYAIYTHAPTYGATQIGESRYGMKLNGQLLDWLSIDAQRNMAMPNGHDWDLGTDLNMKEARRLTTGVKKGIAEHKYDYSADQFDTPAFGWSSTTKHVGIYFINPSTEFLSSGPKHIELTGHLDDGDGGDPTLLDYWRGTHYGGSTLPIAAGEVWTKVVGPIMIYVNSGPTPDAMFTDAKKQATIEQSKWPYTWVNGVDYTPAAQRATVTGQLILRDPQAPLAKLPNLEVGLAYPDQIPTPLTPPDDPKFRPPVVVTWQNDAKHYEFWTRGTPDGKFTLANVRPGTYQLHAIADGVLGEYAKADITIPAGGKIDLGKLEWKPVHYGRQLWQIGVPNRSASEFLHGNNHWHWGEYIEYARLFPNDVNFTIGKSDFRKDWFIYQVPHDLDSPDPSGQGKGRETPWKINFDLATPPAAGQRAVLRLGLTGVGTRSIAVSVNNKDAGSITGLLYNATINRDGVQGSWVEKDLIFDGSLLQAGANTITLTVPAGGITSGIAYDVLRLELSPPATQ